jgi:phosphoribosyl-ATP pyrophosphohydrolase
MTDTLGAALDTLIADVEAKASSDPTSSYTAKLLAAGPAYCAKKLGEEGVELALAIAGGTKEEIANEAADLLYHISVALNSAGVTGEDVAVVLAARRGVSGLDEKASRK